ncbi:hypothetical protein DFH08DRAFT_818271 [Mycena albidolilacea]|uniref:Uncharacterized protein n=1 Tax=Mycena albidolilacea TaxID=1033008 RepID=A0AAD7EHI8_9AGAR|nr:hypothetical protein DFH08DRAFT_818271 [Mycena albidolilacea]
MAVTISGSWAGGHMHKFIWYSDGEWARARLAQPRIAYCKAARVMVKLDGRPECGSGQRYRSPCGADRHGPSTNYFPHAALSDIVKIQTGHGSIMPIFWRHLEAVEVLCSDCSCEQKTLAEFKVTEKGGRARTCLMSQCQAREGARKRKAGKENTEPNSNSDNDELNVLRVLGLEGFLNVLTQQDNNLELDARVEISSLSGNGREKADQLVVLIWKRMKYHFVCVRSAM